EAIRLTELKAQAAGGRTKFGVARAFGEELEDAALVGVEPLARSAAELGQDFAIAFYGGVDLPAARRLRAGVADRPVDDVEAFRVVDEPSAGIHLGIDARPELDRRFELLRTRKGFLGRRNDRCGGKRNQQAKPAEQISRHANVPSSGTTTSRPAELCLPAPAR